MKSFIVRFKFSQLVADNVVPYVFIIMFHLILKCIYLMI
jgi:hypothetical protein